jgi:aerobic carbon-monoxide dehydrogenase medium subunit
MIPPQFEYHVPESLEAASRLLAEYGEEGRILAGGHSLVPMMKLGLASPQHLIDLRRLSGLREIRDEGAFIHIGALTTHYQLESSELLKSRCGLVPETAREIGDMQVRNRGTIGGSLAHSDPAADWPAAILALDSEIEARTASNSRWIPAREYFLNFFRTALRPGEILTAVKVPAYPPRSGSAYLKLRHPASGYAMVGVAVLLIVDESGNIAEVSVGVTGVGPKAYRASAVEDALRGLRPEAGAIHAAAGHAADGIEVNGDLYASAAYRTHLVKIYTERALVLALERARGSHS